MSSEQSLGVRPSPYNLLDELPLRYRPTKLYLNAVKEFESSSQGLLATYRNQSGDNETVLMYQAHAKEGSPIVAFWRAERTEEGVVVDARRAIVLSQQNDGSQLVRIIRSDSGREVATDAGNKVLLGEKFTSSMLFDMTLNPLVFVRNEMTSVQFSNEFEGIRKASFESLSGEFIEGRQLAEGVVSVV